MDKSAESGLPESGEKQPDAEAQHAEGAGMEPSLCAAEAVSYGNGIKDVRKETEMRDAADAVHSLPESGKQEPGSVPAGMRAARPAENPKADTQSQLQQTGRQEMPGYMKVRASVREKLAVIREKRAKEQKQAQAKRKYQAAAL